MTDEHISELGTTEEELYRLFNERVATDNLRKHCQATRAIMEKLAERLGKNKLIWGWAGLLHDLDFEETKDAPEKHGLVTARLLAERGVNETIISAIKAHNAEALGVPRVSPLDYALSCGETITGLIVAAALVRPDKKLAGVEPKSIRKRMKEKAFARNVNRETIMLCEHLGMSVDDFISLSLEAMKGISDELGL
ncbi:MAG: HDIG domain-containing metalloprotein [Bacillota bacterium]